MGYTSEVHIAVPKKAEKEMDAILTTHNLLAEADNTYKYEQKHPPQRGRKHQNGVTTEK